MFPKVQAADCLPASEICGYLLMNISRLQIRLNWVRICRCEALESVFKSLFDYFLTMNLSSLSSIWGSECFVSIKMFTLNGQHITVKLVSLCICTYFTELLYFSKEAPEGQWKWICCLCVIVLFYFLIKWFFKKFTSYHLQMHTWTHTWS